MKQTIINQALAAKAKFDVLKKGVLQFIGDTFIMKPLQSEFAANDIYLFNYLIHLGYVYDEICVYYFNVYLD